MHKTNTQTSDARSAYRASRCFGIRCSVFVAQASDGSVEHKRFDALGGEEGEQAVAGPFQSLQRRSV